MASDIAKDRLDFCKLWWSRIMTKYILLDSAKDLNAGPYLLCPHTKLYWLVVSRAVNWWYSQKLMLHILKLIDNWAILKWGISAPLMLNLCQGVAMWDGMYYHFLCNFMFREQLSVDTRVSEKCAKLEYVLLLFHITETKTVVVLRSIWQFI